MTTEYLPPRAGDAVELPRDLVLWFHPPRGPRRTVRLIVTRFDKHGERVTATLAYDAPLWVKRRPITLYNRRVKELRRCSSSG